jgi:5'-nucleotidase (lipoprotein e(P4) family)
MIRISNTSPMLLPAVLLLFVGPAIQAATPPAESSPPATSPESDLGIAWVRTAAEYDAISRSAYRTAQDALSEKIADKSWSALPNQSGAENLPPAIIFDVDETVVSNVEFQATFERPFNDSKLNDWNNANKAVPVPGVVEFATLAKELGVTLFFLTNRPCFEMAENPDPCPQQTTTYQDVAESGVPVDADKVMLVGQQPGWSKEKSIRRDFIGRSHRVIMLMGDDLGDFIPCTRKRPVDPCTEAATSESRDAISEKYQDYWGNGWYILPNPMHGSWVSVR